jgi:hypothetical protein
MKAMLAVVVAGIGFKVSFTARLAPANEELMEYICQENEQDAVHTKGAAGVP